jgi:hypothetical protein
MGQCRTGRPIAWDEIVQMNYLVAHGKVYDTASFLQDHHHPPCITKGYGMDRSEDYDRHTRREKQIWAKYLVGYLKGGEPPKPP